MREYRQTELEKRAQLAQTIENPSSSPEEILKASDAFRKWKQASSDPIQQLAEECLDPFLNRFGLAMRTDFDPRGSHELSRIEVIDQRGEPIPFEKLSTGTKRIISIALPLNMAKPSNSLVVLDEPEKSLYPDIQKELIDFYKGLCPDSQLVVATHSPMIASAFEPYEIVKLNFDKSGMVHREAYYEGERHIDNCFADPRFMSWQQILAAYFELSASGHQQRREAEKQMETLEQRINQYRFKQAGEEAASTYDQLLKEFEELKYKLGRGGND